jgi:hypothetical protein
LIAREMRLVYYVTGYLLSNCTQEASVPGFSVL